MMRLSPRQLVVKNFVKHKFVWKEFCGVCNHLVRCEFMFKVRKLKGFVYVCHHCCSSKCNAFSCVHPKRITARDVIDATERRKANQRLLDLISDVNKLPDGEVSPSVYSVIIKHSLTLDEED